MEEFLEIWYAAIDVNYQRSETVSGSFRLFRGVYTRIYIPRREASFDKELDYLRRIRPMPRAINVKVPLRKIRCFVFIDIEFRVGGALRP